MPKDLEKLIEKNTDILNKMVEQNRPYNEILKQSQILDKYISEFYKNKK